MDGVHKIISKQNKRAPLPFALKQWQSTDHFRHDARPCLDKAPPSSLKLPSDLLAITIDATGGGRLFLLLEFVVLGIFSIP